MTRMLCPSTPPAAAARVPGWPRRTAVLRRLLIQAGHRCASVSLLLLVCGVVMSYLKSISGMPLLRSASAVLALAFVAAHVSAVSGGIVWWSDNRRRAEHRPLHRAGREARGIVFFSAVCLALGLLVLGLLHLGFITIKS